MSDLEIIVKVSNLNKIYYLYDKPIDRLKETLHPFRKKYHHEFKALENIDFQILKGRTIGILGKNGSGKSTLLKILTGVLTPSSGSVEVKGRIAALLELGAGFNPELSGYDNIFLNGALMGLTAEEMRPKIDDIVKFADIGEFIYQPVKMYSSGMFARLAFAVAINVEPEVLIVDEALSVGDISFQQKCIERIREMLSEGMTFIFVSHDISSLKSICKEALWIHQGKMIQYGDIGTVADSYVQSILGQVQTDGHHFESKLSADVNILNVEVKDNNNDSKEYFEFGDSVTISSNLYVNKDMKNLIVAFYIKNKFSMEVIGTNNIYEGFPLENLSASDKLEVRFRFENRLMAGEYTVTVLVTDSLNSNKYFDWRDGAAKFTVFEDKDNPRWSLVSVPVQVEVKHDPKI